MTRFKYETSVQSVYNKENKEKELIEYHQVIRRDTGFIYDTLKYSF